MYFESIVRRFIFLIPTLLFTQPLLAAAGSDDSAYASGTLQIASDVGDSGTLKANKKSANEPPRFGNFLLPTSQQPSGLFAFGGNIIDKGEVQVFVFADEFAGRNNLVTDLIPLNFNCGWSFY